MKNIVDESEEDEDSGLPSLPSLQLAVPARLPSQEDIEEGCSTNCLLIRRCGHCPGKENCDVHADSDVATEASVLENLLGLGFHIENHMRRSVVRA